MSARGRPTLRITVDGRCVLHLGLWQLFAIAQFERGGESLEIDPAAEVVTVDLYDALDTTSHQYDVADLTPPEYDDDSIGEVFSGKKP